MKSLQIVFVIVLLVACKTKTKECTDCAANDIPQEVNDQNSTAVPDSISEDSAELNLTTDPIQLLEQIQNGEVEFDFYASFTEPFWTIYIIGDQVLFNQVDADPAIYQLNGIFDSTQFSQELSFTDANGLREMLITKDGGSDGMSELAYTFSVVMDESFHGGGDVEYVYEN